MCLQAGLILRREVDNCGQDGSKDHPEQLVPVKERDADELTYLTDVEWKTIFFFIGLFILVGALVKVGVISENVTT